MEEKGMQPESYNYTRAIKRIEQCGDNIEQKKECLRAMLQCGRDCYDYGIGMEYDALKYFEFVLEQTTLSGDDFLLFREGLEEIARDAYKGNSSLSSCESDYIWEKSAMVRMKYKTLFE
ncbi:MAG: hypothetical protein E7093_02515 [Bacteroidales bacterium]|nr:hypothetical protein [Bacteroidales bacterium]